MINSNQQNETVVYLDNAATSFYKPNSVKLELVKAITNYTANPGRSGHKLSQKVAEKIFETRENVKDFFGANLYDLIFTKNCTEALNLAIFGTLKSGDHVITTCYEHNSVLRPLEELKKQGVSVSILDCDMEKVPEVLESKIQSNTNLVITTFVSNVTGEICDVKKVAKICKNHNIKYLIDGAQASGHMQMNLQEIGADMFAFAGHKGLLSISGVGGLFVKDLQNLNPIVFGGTGIDSKNLVQPRVSVEGFEAGTISSISILSLNAGVNYLRKNFSKILEKERNLSAYLYKKLKNLDFLMLYSKYISQNVFSFNVKNLDSATVANILNEEFNICVRSGLHCAPLIHKKMKTNDLGAVRVSLDFNNSFDEIDYLVYALRKIASA